MVDFGSLPPEINSGRMYAGPGSAPMMAAVAAWRETGAELGTAANSYQSVITRLASEEWVGPASAAMAAAASPYVEWLGATAAKIEQAASQAAAAAAAFEVARAATVPPPVVAANRALLASLVAGNVLGQNTPAIATTEAHYGHMWAQDSAAMYSYAADSAAASKVTPFGEPPQTTNPAGQADQAGATAKAAGQSGATHAQDAASQLNSNVPNALQNMASPLESDSGGWDLGDLGPWFGTDDGSGLSLNSQLWNTIASTGALDAGGNLEGLAGVATLGYLARGMDGGTAALASGGAGSGSGMTLASAVGTTSVAGSGGAGGLGSPLSAGMGRASLVGGLSAPPSWAAATPASAGAAAVQSTGWAAAPESGSVATMPGGMPGGAGGRGGYGFGTPRYGFKPTVMPRPVVIG